MKLQSYNVFILFLVNHFLLFEIENLTKINLYIKTGILHIHNTLFIKLIFSNTLIVIIIIPVLLLIIFLLMVLCRKKNTIIKIKEKEIKHQKEIIRSNAMLLLKSTQELLSLNTQKDKFYSIISHELRNYISTIKGFSDLIKTKSNNITEEKKEHYLSMIATTASSTMSLLNNLLEWSRSQQGKLIYNPQTIDLYNLVFNVKQLMKPFAKNKKIEIINKISKDTLVTGDEGMIFTVLRNLLSNAIKFSNSGQNVIVFLEKKDDKVIVHIKDNGIGISRENIVKLFIKGEIYTTLGTENEIGSGIGLMLCKEFIDTHKQEIGVNSSIGRGSDFWFTLKYSMN